MALAHWQSTFTDDEGNIQTGLSVEIRRESNGALAAIFEDIDGNTAKSNPFTTDSFGYGDFYAVSDRYRIQSTDIDWRNVEVLSADKINEVEKRTIYVESVAELEAIPVKIPTDYPDLQSAVDDLYGRYTVFRGGSFDLIFESGHSPEVGLSVSNGDYGHFKISSEDAEVSLSPSFTGKFISATNARAPTLNCLVDAGGFGDDGYYCINGATGLVNIGFGIKNAGGSGCVVQASSSVRAVNTIFTGAAQHGFAVNSCGLLQANDSDANDSGWSGLSCTKGATAVFENSTADNCGANAQAGDPQGGIKCSYSAIVNARGASAKNSFGFGVRSDNNGSCEARDVDVSGASDNGFEAIRGSSISATSSKADNCGTHGYAAFGGSTISCELSSSDGVGGNGIICQYNSYVAAKEAVITNAGNIGVLASELGTIHILNGTSSGSANRDLQVNRGGQIGAANCVTTSGSPALSDTNVAAFNAIDGADGIIWSQ